MSSSRTRLRGLTIQLFTWIVLPTLLVLAFVAYEGTALHERDMHNLVNERDSRAVRAASAGLADRFTQRRLILKGIASRLTDNVSLQHVLADNPELQTVFDGGLIVLDLSGTVVDSWLPAANWASTLRDNDIPWVVEHEGRTPLVVTSTHSPDGKLTLYGGISLTSLNVPAAVSIMRENSQTQFYLVADDGHLLDSSTGILVGTNIKDIVSLDASHISNQDLVTVSSQIEGLNWALFVQEPWSDVITPGLQLSLVAPLATAPAILLAVAILLFGLLRVVLPLRRLGMATQHLSWGDFEAIHQSVGGVQEIRDLQMALKFMAQRVEETQSSMRSHLGAIMRGQEDERRRLSHELHDDTLQSLIALNQKRQMAQRMIDRDRVKANEYLDQLHQMIDETIDGLRKLIRDMRPSYLEDLGLTPALEMLSLQLSTPERTITFSGDVKPHRLPANQELSLYRITQEAITNATRHANATKIKIELHFDDSMTLRIEDNGKGFLIPERPNVYAQSGHYGLMGMVERAEQIGAQFRINSKPGEGTKIEVRFSKNNGNISH